MKSSHTKDTLRTNNTQRNKRKRFNGDVDDRGAGGGAGGVGATDRSELGAHGYEVDGPEQEIHREESLVARVVPITIDVVGHSPRNEFRHGLCLART